MRLAFLEVLKRIEHKIQFLNSERESESLPKLKRVEIRVFGQVGLMLDEEAANTLQLIGTKDLDALIKCDWSARVACKEALELEGLVLDELSSEVWMPSETKYWVFHESPLLRCEVAEPLYILTSKAIKAPEKNKQLIEDALAHYGKRLLALIEKHGKKERAKGRR